MFRNYIAVALRTFAKHQLYAVLNVLGLAAGLACALVIFTYIRGELSYDRWIPDADRIVRVSVTFTPPSQDPVAIAATAYPAAPALAKAYPEQIESFARIGGQPSAVRYGDVSFFETAHYADPSFFEVIRLPLAAGEAATALADPGNAVISERLARKYFGDADPIGKTIVVDAKFPFTVAAVMKDLPFNTHLEMDLVIPIGSEAVRGVSRMTDNWFATSLYTYLRLAPGTDRAALEQALPAFVDAEVPQIPGIPAGVPGSEAMIFALDPLTSIHLGGSRYGEMKPPGDTAAVAALGAIALLVLLIACINFTNLTAAYASTRAREAAVRKIAGATRGQLIVQFVGEAVLLTLVGLLLGVALAEMAQPLASATLGRPVRLDYAAQPEILALMAVLALTTGIAGGLYPAVLISRVRPADALKGSAAQLAGGSGGLRTALVVLQFAISIALGIAASVIYAQTLYAKSMKVGYDRENLLVVTGVGRQQVEPVYDELRERLLAHPDVLTAATSGEIPTGDGSSNTLVRRDATDVPRLLRVMAVEPGYFDVFGMQLLAGREFDPANDADRAPKLREKGAYEVRNVVVSELALAELGFASPEGAIGKTILANFSEHSEYKTVTIVGVVNDVNGRDVREKREPTIYFWAPDWRNYMTLRLTGRNLPDVLAHVDRTWNALVPDLPVRRNFLSETFEAIYAADEQRGLALASFTALAIFIACLGLFGLASFTARRRTKEIGIRKAMGASSADILRLLIWQYSRPVLAANLIAWPIAYFAMQTWLSQFEYRIALDPLFFLGAGVAALAIAWATVATHAWSVARSKPVAALRYE